MHWKRPKKKLRRKFKIEPIISTTGLIKRWYASQGIEEGWDINRVNQLCILLKCTFGELMALCRVSHNQSGWYVKDGFPKSVSLHFELWHRFHGEMVLKKKNPMPAIPIFLLGQPPRKPQPKPRGRPKKILAVTTQNES